MFFSKEVIKHRDINNPERIIKMVIIYSLLSFPIYTNEINIDNNTNQGYVVKSEIVDK